MICESMRKNNPGLDIKEIAVLMYACRNQLIQLADTHACAIDTYLSHAELLNAEDSPSVNVCTFHLLA